MMSVCYEKNKVLLNQCHTTLQNTYKEPCSSAQQKITYLREHIIKCDMYCYALHFEVSSVEHFGQDHHERYELFIVNKNIWSLEV